MKLSLKASDITIKMSKIYPQLQNFPSKSPPTQRKSWKLVNFYATFCDLVSVFNFYWKKKSSRNKFNTIFALKTKKTQMEEIFFGNPRY